VTRTRFEKYAGTVPGAPPDESSSSDIVRRLRQASGDGAQPVSGPVEPTRLDLDRAGLQVLDRRACLDLLSTTGRGRIALTVSALPAILPVRFVLDNDRIVVAASVGTTLDRGTDGNVVAFQADGIDEASQSEWSVGVVGVANHLTQAHDVERAATLPLPRWSAEEPRQFIALSTEQISGRRSLP
jgi:hypothetical protein